MVETAAKNGKEAIALAANLIKVADRNLRLAAEYLAFAEAEGKTQREMAEGVGKSAAWVNRLLQWRRDGFQEDTPFGAQSQERDERHDEQIREECLGPKQQRDEQQRSGPKQKRSSQQRTKREQQVHGFDKERDTLVKTLGMLGSIHDNEALAAARKAEEIRKRLNLTWDDLIATPAEEQRRAA